ncbi:MAG: sulfate reduction electron transfer complex DsrMKJOP subunit DsrJ [Clostridia bacterium]|nr:sulfate reduction electron transfer complex DsrMKJOP subunit DsrJ [Clostridia bacterium]
MYNSRNIIIGLIIFAGIFTFPFILNAVTASGAPEPSLDTPEINALSAKECILDTDYMTSNHMELLADWKIAVVRDGNRIFVTDDGREFEMSLQNTCLECHSNKADFCDACHNYAKVEPNCWDCHVGPEVLK